MSFFVQKMELEVTWRCLATDDNFEVWYSPCASTIHDKEDITRQCTISLWQL